MSRYILGIDEAGYGPNLGPLVIAVTLWKVPDQFEIDHFWGCLESLVTQQIPINNSKLQIADSKIVYRGFAGWDNLEKSVLSLWMTSGVADSLDHHYGRFKKAATCRECEETFLSKNEEKLSIPLTIEFVQLSQFQQHLLRLFQENNVELIRVLTRVVQPGEFNQLLTTHGNKGQLLSQLSLELIRRVFDLHLDQHNPGNIYVYADKQGGRKSYAGLIAEHFPEKLPKVIVEEQKVSKYECGKMLWQFSVASERFFPVAVASMFAKYLRELEMSIFNQFWLELIPKIKPTAGYPVDAKRFFQEIEIFMKKMDIYREVIWRNK